MNLREEQLEKEYIYNGKIITVRRDTALLPNGATAFREVVEHPGGVCVAALDSEDNLLFVKQFRYPYMEETLELPAGKRDRGTDEDPIVCGKRELKEETGATAEFFMPLGTLYPTPGYCGEVIWMFFAKDLKFGDQCPDEDEFLDVTKIPLSRAVDMVISGEIPDAKTQIAVLKVKLLRDRGEI